MAEGRGFLLTGVCQDLSFKVIYSRMEMCRPHVHAEGQDGGKGERRAPVLGGSCVPRAELGTSSSHSTLLLCF